MDYQALKGLIETHPQWPSVSDADLLTWVNEEVYSRDQEYLPVDQVYEAIEASEFAALSASDQQDIRDILMTHTFSGVPTTAGMKARSRMVNIFGAQSTTVQSLAGLISENISRAQNAGIEETIRLGDIEHARSL